MIGLDTNILVRYLSQDDARQSAAATRLIDGELNLAKPGFISLVVLVELCWVLKRLYAATEGELAAMTQDLLDAPQFHMEQRDVVRAALQHLAQAKSAKAGLADVLIAKIAKAHGCTQTLSFDKGAVRAAGMVLLD